MMVIKSFQDFIILIETFIFLSIRIDWYIDGGQVDGLTDKLIDI